MVGDGNVEDSTGHEQLPRASEEVPRVPGVLQHVSHRDRVVAAAQGRALEVAHRDWKSELGFGASCGLGTYVDT